MAQLTGYGKKEGGNSTYNQLLKKDSGVHICRLSPEKGVSLIRIIPERHADGTLRPMFNGSVNGVNDWSNVYAASITSNAGQLGDKMTVINEPSDSGGQGQASSWPLSGLYIRLKSMEKKNELPPHMREKVMALMKGRDDRGFGAALSRPQDTLAFQAIVKTINGKVLEKAVPKQVVLMSSTTAESLDKILLAAHTAGQDLFGPNGYWIKFEPEKQRGSGVVLSTAVLGDPCPASETMLKTLWVPWEQIWVRKTRKELLIETIRAFGRDVVQLAFSNEVEELYAAQPGMAATQAAAATAPAVTNAAAAAPAAVVPLVFESVLPGKAGAAMAPSLDDMLGDAGDISGGDKPDDAPPAAAAPVTASKPPNAAEAVAKYKALLAQDMDLPK